MNGVASQARRRAREAMCRGAPTSVESALDGAVLRGECLEHGLHGVVHFGVRQRAIRSAEGEAERVKS